MKISAKREDRPALLAAGLEALGLAVSKADRARLIAYAELLLKWNKVYNLTAIRDPAEVITLHLLDSLAVLPHLAAVRRLADVGSGGGLPGIPLAILRPELEVLSIEPVQKKSSFQLQAKIELGLPNFNPRCARVEDVVAEPGMDAVISRAFAELADFVRGSAHLLAPGGRLFAMKGAYPEDEVARLPAGWRVERSIELAVPGLEARRHLLILQSEADS